MIVILELCDHPIAGACASQSKEEVVTVRVDYRAWRWREDLEESISVSKKVVFQPEKDPDLGLLRCDLRNPAIGKNDPHAQDILRPIPIPATSDQ